MAIHDIKNLVELVLAVKILNVKGFQINEGV